MRIPTCLHAGVAATGIAVVGIAAMAAAPLAPVTQSQSPPTVAQDVRLAAATVPPGGLITSFLGNQVIYCSLICPLLAQTVVTPVVTTLQTPGTFLTALQSGNLLKAIGITAASVTGPTNAAAEQAILVDGSIPAKRALNAFEVGVVGLLNVVPAAAGGLPGIALAIETARQDTFTALNLPVVANPTPTVMPHGVVQVAVVGLLNVGGAVIFPAFNDILSGAFQTPDAVAQELAATGDPVRAVAAGVNTAAGAATAAVTVIADVGRHRAQRHPHSRRAICLCEPADADAEFRHDNNAGRRRGGTTSPIGRGDDQTRQRRARDLTSVGRGDDQTRQRRARDLTSVGRGDDQTRQRRARDLPPFGHGDDQTRQCRARHLTPLARHRFERSAHRAKRCREDL